MTLGLSLPSTSAHTPTYSEREGKMVVYDINNTIVLHEWLIVQ